MEVLTREPQHSIYLACNRLCWFGLIKGKQKELATMHDYKSRFKVSTLVSINKSAVVVSTST